ncbi:hypothetical protein TBR22_A47830 [Luteitalea sp. TBR-22]|uniref:hypothetical protein n=1 Tax=Luteitalea sp. TBR-22 TaxID=2802971 RepID=UPI001AFAAFCB|nr:hypothetical protein [Luteitalea sp. TBR-22]BCS35550.1 hypothetical protein TBR22_A47830 [Luteitalea sp. TBR-22]
MSTSTLRLASALAALLVAGGGLALVSRRPVPPRPPIARRGAPLDELRQRLYDAVQPVRLANCTLERFGEAHDGGYLMCGNLLAPAAGYSYGISGYDGWGCQMSKRFGIPVHQYDCFDPRRPSCEGGDTRFHGECVAGEASVDPSGRPFDAVAAQVTRNGDPGKRLVMKMDVEGAEWASLLAAPREVLEQIDQLTIELHLNGPDLWTKWLVVSKLRDVFHVAHHHVNNYGCRDDLAPFPSWAIEVLFVNKRLAVAVPGGPPIVRPHPLDAPNDPTRPDCQYAPGTRPTGIR